MKANRPNDFIVMPQNGYVRIGADEHLYIDQESLPNPSHDDALAMMDRARAEVLGATFPVENELVLAVLADRFNTKDPQLGGPDYLTAEQKLRKDTFGTHVKAATKLLDREGLLSDVLRSALAELLTVRNAMAHRPCWLEALTDGTGRATSFVAKCADDNFIWTIDDEQLREWATLANGCLAVRDLTDQMLERRQAPATRQQFTGWPLMVRLPPGDPLGQHSAIEGVALAGTRILHREAT